MEENEIEELYELIEQLYNQYLRNRGVHLPRLRDKEGKFTKDALTLVYLAQGYPETRWVSKTELTDFIRKYYQETNDVQSARHLGMQKGFYIVSSRRGNYIPENNPPPDPSTYLLVSLEKPHPAFKPRRREGDDANFEEVKRRYGYHCATCGSKEGEENLRYPGQITQLQKAHRNPKQPLEGQNMIPQCQFCNRPDRNYWVYDERGRVIGVADPRPILKSVKEGYLDEKQVEKLYHDLESLLRQRKGRTRGR
jgi:hypothetical protein